ncbi:hypothetical protein DWX10_25260 [Clostridium sp. AF18-27]|nr:hypothetical protein DWX10_25260 [Clostridium sp. AF18-27]
MGDGAAGIQAVVQAITQAITQAAIWAVIRRSFGGYSGSHPGSHPGIRGFTFSGAHSTMMGAKRLSAVALWPPVF